MLLPSALASPACTSGAAVYLDDSCRHCRVSALRLHEVEQAAAALRHELEKSSRRLQAAMAQLALAEERAGHGALAGAIRSVAAGQTGLSPDAAWALLGEREAGRARTGTAAPQLGAREREVLQLITEGQRTPSIAERLGIRIATVEVHRRNIMRKLGLHTVAALTKYALREGLTSL